MQADKWVVLRIQQEDGNYIYKLLMGFYGSYTGASSWILNSGIESIEREGKFFWFHGFSGSKYSAHMSDYGTTLESGMILQKIFKAFGSKITVMPEDTDWNKLLED